MHESCVVRGQFLNLVIWIVSSLITCFQESPRRPKGIAVYVRFPITLSSRKLKNHKITFSAISPYSHIFSLLPILFLSPLISYHGCHACLPPLARLKHTKKYCLFCRLGFLHITYFWDRNACTCDEQLFCFIPLQTLKHAYLDQWEVSVPRQISNLEPWRCFVFFFLQS